MTRAGWISACLCVFLLTAGQAQDSSKTDQKATDPQKAAEPKYQEPEEEDDGSKPAKAYAFNPVEAQACMKIGNDYFARGKYRAAAFRFKEATKWNPMYSEAFLRLGQASEKNSNTAGAKEAYGKYLELSPDAKNAAEIRKKLASLK